MEARLGQGLKLLEGFSLICRGICALGPPRSSPAEKLMLYVVACEMKMEMPWGCMTSRSLPAQQRGEFGDGAASASTLPNPALAYRVWRQQSRDKIIRFPILEGT